MKDLRARATCCDARKPRWDPGKEESELRAPQHALLLGPIQDDALRSLTIRQPSIAKYQAIANFGDVQTKCLQKIEDCHAAGVVKAPVNFLQS